MGERGSHPKLATRQRRLSQRIDAAMDHPPAASPPVLLDHPARPTKAEELPRRDDVGLARGELSDANVDFTTS
jgi:hypothetical protein